MNRFIERSFTLDRWQIVVGTFDSTTGDGFRILHTISAPKWHQFNADPFIKMCENNAIEIVFEFFDYFRPKGCIKTVQLKFDEKKSISVNNSDLDDPSYHCSFPCVSSDGSMLVIERSERPGIYLTQLCGNFDTTEIFEFFESKFLVDPSIAQSQDSISILWTEVCDLDNLLVARFTLKNSKFCLESVNSIYRDDGTPAGRNAGRLLKMGDAIMRPRQVSNNRYGEFLIFQRHEQDGVSGMYIEEPWLCLCPRLFSRDAVGLHHFDARGNVFVADINIPIFCIFALPLKLFLRITRSFRALKFMGIS